VKIMLIDKINGDTTIAMKSQDKFSLSVLRMLKSSIQNEAINKTDDLSDEDVIAVIKKQVKVRKDSKHEYVKYDRMDLADSLDREIELLSRYLPEELSEEEIEKVIKDVFNKVNPTSVKDMGLIMRELTPLLASKADMSVVSSLVRAKLNK